MNGGLLLESDNNCIINYDLEKMGTIEGCAFKFSSPDFVLCSKNILNFKIHVL